MNHEKIIEGISQAFNEIGDHVRDCTSELDLFPTEQMQGRISDLYAHIFLFLTSIMDWIMQKRYKRMLDSFNQNFMERFKVDIDLIKSHAERVRQLAAQASRAEVRVSRLTADNEFRALRNDLRIGLEEIARTRAEIAYRDRLKEIELAEATRDREQLAHRTQLLTSFLSEVLEQSRQLGQPSLQILNRSPSPFCAASHHSGKSQLNKKEVLR